MVPKIVFTKDQEAYLREHYPTDAQCDIAIHLGVSAPVVHRIAMEMGLKKADGWSKKQYQNHMVKTYKHERYSTFR